LYQERYFIAIFVYFPPFSLVLALRYVTNRYERRFDRKSTAPVPHRYILGGISADHGLR
jgi:hypothetical protein